MSSNPYRAPEASTMLSENRRGIVGHSRYGRFKNPAVPANWLIGFFTVQLIDTILFSELVWPTVSTLGAAKASAMIQFSAVLSWVLLIAIYGCLIYWSLRVARNSRAIRHRPKYPTIRPGRIAISWIIPIVGGFVPFYCLNKVRKESGMTSHTALLIWWIGWGLFPVLGMGLGWVLITVDRPHLSLVTLFSHLDDALTVISCIAAILFVHNLSAIQSRLLRR